MSLRDNGAKETNNHAQKRLRLPFFIFTPPGTVDWGMTEFSGNYLFQKRFRLCVTFRLKRELNPGDRIRIEGSIQSISPQLSAVLRNVIFFESFVTDIRLRVLKNRYFLRTLIDFGFIPLRRDESDTFIEIVFKKN